jgi:IS5 family transposase
VGEANSEDPEVAEAASLLRRILVQDLEAVPSAEKTAGDGDPDGQAVLELGQEVQIRQGVAENRIVSVGDPEMRHGHKSHNRSWEGYKAHLSVEAGHGFITAVEVTQANVGDGQAAPMLLEAQKGYGLKPAANVGDMAYSGAALRQRASEQETEIVARVPPSSGAPGCFRKEDFQIDLEAGAVTCPAGATTRHVISRSPDGARLFVFQASICGTCALRSQCLKNPAKFGRRGRTITIHPLEGILQAARAAEKTERVRDLLKLRWIVERGIAHLVRRGLRQARYFGTAKVQYQALSAALATNLARLAKVSGCPAPPPCMA